jgi:hypothetical protein
LVSTLFPEVFRGELELLESRFSDRGRGSEVLKCRGKEVDGSEPVNGEAWLFALVIAAFNMCASVGLIPHAKHGGRGV